MKFVSNKCLLILFEETALCVGIDKILKNLDKMTHDTDTPADHFTAIVRTLKPHFALYNKFLSLTVNLNT